MRVQVEGILEEAKGLSEEELDYLVNHMRELLKVVKARREAQSETEADGKRDILEFEGVGAEMWQAIDSDQYLQQLRSEWDEDSHS
jgi:hypothetical protein